MVRKYWLMKCELAACSFDELKSDRPDSTGKWRGVRNYQARNFMRDEMRKGDWVLFYQSSCDTPGVPGLAVIAREGYPDPSAFDEKNPYYDPKSSPEKPQWYSVDVKWKKKFKNYVSLRDIKATPELSDMRVVQRFQRLSIQPVNKEHFQKICDMGGIKINA